MVCEKCESKLEKGSLCVPDKWKDGAFNTNVDAKGGRSSAARGGAGGASSSGGGRQVGATNMLLKHGPQKKLKGSASRKHDPIGVAPLDRKCRICKSTTGKKEYYYCQGCAYQKGICAMCGRKVQDVKNRNMSAK